MSYAKVLDYICFIMIEQILPRIKQNENKIISDNMKPKKLTMKLYKRFDTRAVIRQT